MGKVKIEKKDVWIDMTPMSDVMVLLLTFFMLTSTFVKNEPVKVNTPGSVSEIKVPEQEIQRNEKMDLLEMKSRIKDSRQMPYPFNMFASKLKWFILGLIRKK